MQECWNLHCETAFQIWAKCIQIYYENTKKKRATLREKRMKQNPATIWKLSAGSSNLAANKPSGETSELRHFEWKTKKRLKTNRLGFRDSDSNLNTDKPIKEIRKQLSGGK